MKFEWSARGLKWNARELEWNSRECEWGAGEFECALEWKLAPEYRIPAKARMEFKGVWMRCRGVWMWPDGDWMGCEGAWMERAVAYIWHNEAWMKHKGVWMEHKGAWNTTHTHHWLCQFSNKFSACFTSSFSTKLAPEYRIPAKGSHGLSESIVMWSLVWEHCDDTIPPRPYFTRYPCVLCPTLQCPTLPIISYPVLLRITVKMSFSRGCMRHFRSHINPIKHSPPPHSIDDRHQTLVNSSFVPVQ